MSPTKRARSILWGGCRAQGAGAFSLVEVVIAVAITVFALVALLGLMSLGLNTSRESIEETLSGEISTYIYQELATDAISAEDLSSDRTSPFNPSKPSTIRNYYFSRDGQFLGYTKPAAVKNPFFLATATVVKPTSAGASSTANISDPTFYPNISSKELRAVTLVIRWPVDASSGLPPPAAHGNTSSFLLSKALYRQSLEGAR